MLPHLSRAVDDIAFVRSVHTDQFNHAPAQILMSTGSSQCRAVPSIGRVGRLTASEARRPTFPASSSSAPERKVPAAGNSNWSKRIFARPFYQGVQFRGKRRAGPLSSPTREAFDRRAPARYASRRSSPGAEPACVWTPTGDPEIATPASACLRDGVPDARDRPGSSWTSAGEPKHILEMYGAEPGKRLRFANNCLLARRLIENGVRFVDLYSTKAWDQHWQSSSTTSRRIAATDRQGQSAALVKDLKQRGLLDDTLVVWGGEFGRTPMVQSNAALGRSLGRDHHPNAFTMWLAGGGIKGGDHPRRDRRPRLRRHRATRSTSTTFTPRCSTSSASTTPS